MQVNGSRYDLQNHPVGLADFIDIFLGRPIAILSILLSASELVAELGRFDALKGAMDSR